MTSLRVILRSRFGNPNLRYTQVKYLEFMLTSAFSTFSFVCLDEFSFVVFSWIKLLF